MQVQVQDGGYSLRLSDKELRTIVCCLLVLPDRYTHDAVEDLVGCSKQEIDELQTKIADAKYVTDQVSARRWLVDQGIIGSRPDEDAALRAKPADELMARVRQSREGAYFCHREE